MGAGASAGGGGDGPGVVTKEKAATLAGDHFDESKWQALPHNDDGSVSAETWSKVATQHEEVLTAWNLYDTNSNGFISQTELALLLKELDMAVGADDDDMAGVLAEMELEAHDENGDGKLSFKEFWRWWSAQKGDGKLDDGKATLQESKKAGAGDVPDELLMRSVSTGFGGDEPLPAEKEPGDGNPLSGADEVTAVVQAVDTGDDVEAAPAAAAAGAGGGGGGGVDDDKDDGKVEVVVSTLRGKALAVPSVLATDTVLSLKAAVEAAGWASCASQSIMFEGRTLTDDAQVLAEAGLSEAKKAVIVVLAAAADAGGEAAAGGAAAPVTDDERTKQIQEIFEQLDVDKKGVLDRAAMRNLLVAMGLVDAGSSDEGLDKLEVDQALEDADTDAVPGVDAKEFAAYLCEQIGNDDAEFKALWDRMHASQ